MDINMIIKLDEEQLKTIKQWIEDFYKQLENRQKKIEKVLKERGYIA